MADEQWYWCQRHGRVEPASHSCPADQRIGPFPTREAATNWQDTIQARNEAWDAADKAWEGDDEDDD
jgi:hypothetical protein